MTKYKLKKFISVILCLFTIVFVIFSSVISVSAATYFSPGGSVEFDNDTNRFGLCGFLAYQHGDSVGQQFWYKGETPPENFTQYAFKNFGFGISWHPQYSRNYIKAGSYVNIDLTMSPAFFEWAYNLRVLSAVDPAKFFSIRCSSSSLAEANKWDNGTYYNQSTLVTPSRCEVVYPGTVSSPGQATTVSLTMLCPIETVSFIVEFNASAFNINLDDYSLISNFGYIVDAFSFIVTGINETYAKLEDAQNGLNNATSDFDGDMSDLESAEGEVNDLIDFDTILSNFDADNFNYEKVISSDKIQVFQAMMFEIYDSFGAEVNFVLMFSLIIGLACYIIGKKVR